MKPYKEQSIGCNIPGRFPQDSELIIHKGHCVPPNESQNSCYQELTNSLDFQNRENKHVTYKEKGLETRFKPMAMGVQTRVPNPSLKTCGSKSSFYKL